MKNKFFFSVVVVFVLVVVFFFFFAVVGRVHAQVQHVNSAAVVQLEVWKEGALVHKDKGLVSVKHAVDPQLKYVVMPDENEIEPVYRAVGSRAAELVVVDPSGVVQSVENKVTVDNAAVVLVSEVIA